MKPGIVATQCDRPDAEFWRGDDMSRMNDLAESMMKTMDRTKELEAENARLQRYKAAWDWCDNNERFPVCSNELNWNDFATPLEAVEAAIKEATDAAK